MIVVKVTYTVKLDFAPKNQANIRAFMDDFKKIESNDFYYTAYVLEDGKTFVHLSMYQNEAIQQHLLNIVSFKYFQQQRDESGLELLPKIETMQLVASAKDIF